MILLNCHCSITMIINIKVLIFTQVSSEEIIYEIVEIFEVLNITACRLSLMLDVDYL